MKNLKFLLLACGLMGAMSLTSCKKDYNCTCNFTPGSGDSTLVVPIENASKSDAEDACEAAETTYKIAYPNTTCSLD